MLLFFSEDKERDDIIAEQSFLTPEMFGAKGNGLDDDTSAIQLAINNSNGCPVLFDSKTYVVSQTIVLPDNSILIGHITKIVNNNQTLPAVFLAYNANKVIIDGFEIDFRAKKTKKSNSRMFRDGVITLSGEKGCNNSMISNCKIYNLNYLQSGIVLKGENVEISHCEVFSGAGNRMNAGIVCGSYDHSSPTSKSNGGCNYASVHDCYVHDISIGSKPDESGYGIYLLSCNYSSVYNCRVENCNWVCINSQTEQNLPLGGHNYIYNNITRLDSKKVCPRSDYIGPYNIYLEASPSSVVINNVIICGEVNSKRYIPLQIAWGCSDCLVKDNRFINTGKQNTFALVGVDDKTVYDNNECNFSPSTYFFCYNTENPYLYVRNCNISATKRMINYLRNNSKSYNGILIMQDCKINAPMLKVSSTGDVIKGEFVNCYYNERSLVSFSQ